MYEFTDYVVATFHLGTGGHYWIGLTDEVIAGVYIWRHDNTTPTYTDWAPGEPNEWFSLPQCCHLYGVYDWKWVDAPCSWQGHNGPLYPLCEGNKQF